MQILLGAILGIATLLALRAILSRAERPRLQPELADPEPDARLDELLDDGRKIQAVKLYRELHGVDLTQAKIAVDALARRR
ncbi:MAG: hypothetical protein ABFS46_14350 [Myxococcota bacterium]